MQFKLIKSRRFLPLFITQFLGAFNDNFFKSALIMLITFKLADAAGLDARVMVNAAAGLFILPFFIFAAPAGDLNNKFNRAALMRWVKFAEILIMALAAVGFWLGSLPLLLAVLFLMGGQSAFFSPAKYSILPQHLNPDELIAGNGLIQMGTYLAILTGTICGGVLILKRGGVFIVGGGVICVAALGYLASLFIPSTTPVDKNQRVSWRLLSRTLAIIKQVRPLGQAYHAMLAVSWFWLVGATFLAQFPTYARLVLNGDENLATAFLAIFSCGIGVGSITCDLILKGRVSTRYVPAAAYAIAILSAALYFLTDGANTNVLAIIACLFLIAFAGGLYIVPLYAIMQSRAPAGLVSSVIACSNIYDSIFMAASALISGVLIARGWEIRELFLLLCPTTAAVGILIKFKIKS